MQTNEPSYQSQQTNVPLTAETSIPQRLNTSIPITSWLLVGLVILLFGSTGLFAFKYYELRKQFESQASIPSRKQSDTHSLTPLVSTKVVKPSPSPTVVSKISEEQKEIIIPDDWKTYNKNFAGTHFSFRYPKTSDVWDLDESSGEIYIIKEGGPNWPADVVIDNMLHIWSQFDPYLSGSRRVWFKNNLSKLYRKQDLSSLSFDEVSFPNGKSYLRVYNWSKTSEFENDVFFQGDFYFGVQNRKVVYVSDKKTLPKEDVEKILYSLEIR